MDAQYDPSEGYLFANNYPLLERNTLTDLNI